MMLPLKIDDLSFRYRDRQATAIEHISFEVEAGSLWLIAGPSGCGKTTLVRALNGLSPRSYKGDLEGKILVYGQDTRPWPLARISQYIGTVLQDPERQILGTKVLHEVAFGLENLGLPRQEILERVEESMRFLNIWHLHERETFSLSGGEKQKVALAGVLAMRPKILLLDEPLASLDPASAQEALQMVRMLVDEGLSVLMVEHRVEDVLSIHPDRVLLMEKGRVRYLGEADGLRQIVHYRELKLPAEWVIDLARHDPPPRELDILPSARDGKDEAPLVRFEQVSFGYDSEREVLHDISLDIRRGDVIAVLGPNGAGKTTFIKHAIGLLKPVRGKVQVGGKDTSSISIAEIAHTLGYVFQSPSHMLFAPTVEKELAFGPRNLGHDAGQIAQDVDQALATVNLSEYKHDPPLALSFGQQKRVSIAAILAMRSRILVMDEPTAGQDYSNYMNFMDAILQMPGFEAILFITHDLDLAQIYANRVLLLADGALQADGKPEDVLSDFALLEKCRVVPSSLLRANVQRLPQTGRFLRAEALAHAHKEV